jgi:hypothetical protein
MKPCDASRAPAAARSPPKLCSCSFVALRAAGGDGGSRFGVLNGSATDERSPYCLRREAYSDDLCRCRGEVSGEGEPLPRLRGRAPLCGATFPPSAES